MKANPDTIAFWTARAEAYDRNTRDWGIFPAMATRLAEAALDPDFAGRLIDLGGGTGATSEAILAHRPSARVLLLDPSQGMLRSARTRLGTRVQYVLGDLRQALALGLKANAVLCSAAMHYIDLDPAFEALARILVPGGRFAFNLWWHNWAETEALPGFQEWIPLAEAACREAGLPFIPPPPTPRAPKTRRQLGQAAQRHGLRQIFESRDVDRVSLGFSVAFQAMNPQWPVPGLPPERRQALLDRIQALGGGREEDLLSLRFVLEKA